MRITQSVQNAKQILINRLTLGVLVGATTMVVGTASAAAAPSVPMPTSKDACKTQFAKFGDEHGTKFKNQGQCVSWWNHHHNGGGHGYGGGHGNNNNVGTTVNVDAHNSHDNVFNIVINYIFG